MSRKTPPKRNAVRPPPQLVVSSRFCRDQFRAFRVVDPHGRITDWVGVEYPGARPRVPALENELRVCLQFARTTSGAIRRTYVARAIYWRRVVQECRRVIAARAASVALQKLTYAGAA